MSILLSRTIGVLVAAAVMFAGHGCADPHAEDKAAIRKLMHEYSVANQERNGKAVVEMMTPETLAHYTSLVKLGLDGTEAEVRKLDAFDRQEILMMRSMATRKDLKGKDGRAYQIWATEQGWYASGEDEYASWTDGMSDIKIDLDGKGAWCYIKEDGKRTRFMLRFVKGQERWHFEETSAYEYIGDLVQRAARESRMTEDEVLIIRIEDEYDVEIDPKTIWKPMKK